MDDQNENNNQTPEERFTVAEVDQAPPADQSSAPVATQASPVEPAATEQTTTEPPKAVVGKRSHPLKKLLMVIVLAALLLGAAGAAFYKYALNNVSETPDTAAPTVVKKELENLRIGSPDFAYSFFYPDVNFLTGSAYSVNFQMYEGLAGYKNGNSVVPLLAESWTNPDDKTWVFKIKENVKFHDGSIMTAEDVKRSFEVAQKSDIPSLITGTIDSVEVQDATHVVVKTKTADPILINKIVFVMILGKEDSLGVATGTGAYKLAAEVKDDKKPLRLTAFDDYHSGRPLVRNVEYSGYETNEKVIAALKNNEIDASEFFDDQTFKTDIAGFKVTEFPGPNVNFVGFNTEDTSSPLNKKEVRQAIRLLIDPQRAMETQNATGRLLSQFTIPEYFGYNPALEPAKVNVDEAKKLIAKAGYPNGFKLTFLHNTARANFYKQYKEELAKADITLEPQVEDDTAKFFGIIDGGTGEMFQYYVASALVDSYDIFAYNFQNLNYDNPDFNALIDKSNATFDATERKKLMQDASKLLVDDVAGIPLFNPNVYSYLRENINFEQNDIAGLPSLGYIKNISANK